MSRTRSTPLHAAEIVERYQPRAAELREVKVFVPDATFARLVAAARRAGTTPACHARGLLEAALGLPAPAPRPSRLAPEAGTVRPWNSPAEADTPVSHAGDESCARRPSPEETAAFLADCQAEAAQAREVVAASGGAKAPPAPDGRAASGTTPTPTPPRKGEGRRDAVAAIARGAGARLKRGAPTPQEAARALPKCTRLAIKNYRWAGWSPKRTAAALALPVEVVAAVLTELKP